MAVISFFSPRQIRGLGTEKQCTHNGVDIHRLHALGRSSLRAVGNKDLSLASVAAEVGYHKKYLSHRFRLYTGVGFNRYLKDLRVKNAVFLMDNGVHSVKNVALLCGFGDPLYFSKVFRETVGISPKNYRKNP